MSKICTAGANEANLTNNDIRILLKVAKTAALTGGRSLMNNYGNLQLVKSKSNSSDLVTNADLESEELILNYLNKETPDISILAEESGATNASSEITWCIDPLDGTTNYSHGYPLFATSVGLIYKNLPILGAISVPYLNEIYYAAPSLGSFCNDVPIHVNSTRELEKSLLVTGFSYDRKEVVENNYAEFCLMTHQTHGVRRGGAAAVDMAFIAAGKLDGYWERGLAKWDLAAGVPIVEEAGGVISDYPNGEFNLENGRILACTPAIKENLAYELGKVVPINPSKLLRKDL